MRCAAITIMLALVAGCQPDPIRLSADNTPQRIPTPGDVDALPSHPALELHAQLAVDAPVAAGDPVEVTASIVNKSDRAVAIVQAGDGSHVGWREPHLYYTAQHDGRPVDKLAYSRCGNYDSAWDQDVTMLQPGAALPVALRSTPDYHLDIQSAGLTELRLHYRYAAGEAGKGLPRFSTLPAALSGVQPFELVSAPMMLEVVRPLDVHLEVIAPIEAGKPKAIEETFRVTLRNDAAAPRNVESPRGRDNYLYFETSSSEVHAPHCADDWDAPVEKADLAPGARAAVLGPDSVFESVACTWTVDEPQTVRVRADFGGVRSNWVAVTVR